MNPNVYCVIVTYNAMKWVDNCLTSLRNSITPIRSVVIDNCSKDNTVDYISTNYPEVHIIVNKENRGFGQANNQGIEWAYKQGATHFFLLNQDAWIESNTISNLIEIQDKEKISVAVPIHLSGNGDRVDFGYYKYIQHLDCPQVFIADLIKLNPKDFYIIDFANAAGWVISRNTIEEVGGFDPVFFHYGEDRNYAQRLKYHKKSLAIIPSSIMYHDRDQHGNEKMYNDKRVISTLLREYADITKKSNSFYLSRLKLHLWLFKGMIIKFLKFDINGGLSMLNGFISFYKAKKTIQKSIEVNSILGHNWLDI